MRSALYFPHTEIHTPNLIKTSLLLWDKLRFIVPGPGYRPYYPDKQIARAIEIIGDPHYPTDAEKKYTHEVIEEFATRPLPEPFYYREGDHRYENDYEMYPQKLLPETWDILQRLQLTSNPLANSDYPLTQAAGLTVMSILTDSCAGEQYARVTDRGVAYATIANLTVEKNKPISFVGSEEQLVAVSMDVLDLSDLPLEDLINFREREEREGKGGTLKSLRHNYLAEIETRAKALTKAKTESDWKELQRVFREDTRSDLKTLAKELRRTKIDSVLSKETLAVLALIPAGIAAAHFLPFAIPAAASLSGVPVTIAGALSGYNKYSSAREAVLQKHSMAYIYELERTR